MSGRSRASSGAAALVTDYLAGKRQALTALRLATKARIDLPDRAAAVTRLGPNLFLAKPIAHTDDHAAKLPGDSTCE